MINDEDALFSLPRAIERLKITVIRLARQDLPPGREKDFPIDCLMFLGSGRRISATGYALVVEDWAHRLIKHFQTALRDLEGQISIFVVSGSILWIEASNFFKGGLPHHDAGGGTV